MDKQQDLLAGKLVSLFLQKTIVTHVVARKIYTYSKKDHHVVLDVYFGLPADTNKDSGQVFIPVEFLSKYPDMSIDDIANKLFEEAMDKINKITWKKNCKIINLA